jgi:hypothetical protein
LGAIGGIRLGRGREVGFFLGIIPCGNFFCDVRDVVLEVVGNGFLGFEILATCGFELVDQRFDIDCGLLLVFDVSNVSVPGGKV